MLQTDHLSCGFGLKTVVRDVSIRVRQGEVFCLLGPNGAGKTTLFRTVLGLLKPKGGSVTINGIDTGGYKPAELAKLIGYVPQAHTPPFPYRVIDVVLMGRVSHLGRFGTPAGEDNRIAYEALELLGITGLADEAYTEISGGEKQLTLIARALTQQADYLVLDEPTSNLDFGNRAVVLKHIRRLAENGRGILMTTHEPNHAVLCADRAAAIKNGEILFEGSPSEMITAGGLEKIYGTGSRIISAGGYCVPAFG